MAFRLEFRNLCRICLTEEGDLIDIFALGESTEKWIEDIKGYYNVQIRSNEVKSTKLCPSCLENIRTWHKDKTKAINNQVIVDFLSDKLKNVNYNGRVQETPKCDPLQEKKN